MLKNLQLKGYNNSTRGTIIFKKEETEEEDREYPQMKMLFKISLLDIKGDKFSFVLAANERIPNSFLFVYGVMLLTVKIVKYSEESIRLIDLVVSIAHF